MFDPKKDYGYSSGVANEFNLRDYFAAMVLPSVYTQHKGESDEDVALIAYNIADAMMRQRKHG